MTADPDVPAGAEAKLQGYQEALDDAREELREARDKEVEAELARDAAYRWWMLSDECPPVGVRDGVRTTVAYRDAWVADRIAGEERAFKLAKAKRQAAATKLHTLGKNGGFQQSITASVRENYRGTNSRGYGS